MKKILIIFQIIFLINLFNLSYLSERAYCDGIDINPEIEEQAIVDPLSLPVWSPPTGNTDSVIGSSDSSNWGIIVPALGSAIPAIIGGTYAFLKKNPKATTPANLQPVNYQTGLGGEMLYNIDFKNSQETPIYSDTIIYIEIPEWLSYSNNSLRLNDKRLTDKSDDDRLTYIDDNILKLNLSGLDGNKKTSITFGARILDKKPDKNESFCTIKFISPYNNIKMEWKPFSKP